jgi:hypothetical protein
MANVVDSLVLEDNGIVYKQRYLVLSDGTAMTDEIMIDKSTLTSKVTGREPHALDLMELEAVGWGTMNSVLLEWDHTIDDEILAFGVTGGGVKWCPKLGDLKDPVSEGGTGDIIITTNGLAANAGFMIVATWRLRTLTA